MSGFVITKMTVSTPNINSEAACLTLIFIISLQCEKWCWYAILAHTKSTVVDSVQLEVTMN